MKKTDSINCISYNIQNEVNINLLTSTKYIFVCIFKKPTSVSNERKGIDPVIQNWPLHRYRLENPIRVGTNLRRKYWLTGGRE